jgi:hypothetical protein
MCCKVKKYGHLNNF